MLHIRVSLRVEVDLLTRRTLMVVLGWADYGEWQCLYSDTWFIYTYEQLCMSEEMRGICTFTSCLKLKHSNFHALPPTTMPPFSMKVLRVWHCHFVIQVVISRVKRV